MPVALVARVFDTQANQQFDVTFERFPVRIGRNQLNDLHIDRPYVSQFHAAIDIRDRPPLEVRANGRCSVIRPCATARDTVHCTLMAAIMAPSICPAFTSTRRR